MITDKYKEFKNQMNECKDVDSLLDLNVDIITAGACGEISEKELEQLLRQHSKILREIMNKGKRT